MTIIVPDNDSFVEITATTISNLVQRQFPANYQANSPVFIAFIKAYYQWLEATGNPLYYSRRFFNIVDIDKTLDQFIVYFKQKYLNNIPLETMADTRQIIKHALDLYRSKGTPREIELLFQLIYQVPISFYLPSTDLFKLSDGIWNIPYYIELQLNEINVQLEGKEITGLQSGAVGFIDRIIRTTTSNRLIDIAFISAITGNFQTNEKILPTDGSITVQQCPTIIGSLSSIVIESVDGTGQEYSTGQIVSISSQTGTGALGRITGTANAFGVVDIQLINGGFGFSSTANVWVSNTVLTLANVAMTANQWYLQFGDTVIQPTAFIQYINATATFNNGTPITTYYSNGSVMGTGIITFSIAANSTTGNVSISVLSGNCDNTFYTASNAASAKISSYSNTSASGIYIGKDNVITVNISNSSVFIPGETIINLDVVGSSAVVSSQPANTQLQINTVAGGFQWGQRIFGLSSQSVTLAQEVDIIVGLCNVSGTFVSSNSNYITSNNISNSTCTRIYNGSGAAVGISAISNTETVSINTDLIGSFANVMINANTYPFLAANTANLTNINIGSTWTFSNLTIGSINQIVVSNTGINYNHVPIITINQQQISSYVIHDYKISYITSGGNFNIGELVTQAATGARGVVQAQTNSTVVFLTNYWFANNFVPTTNSTTVIIGSSSQITANVISADFNNQEDYYSTQMGLNAQFNSTFTTGNGSITSIDVIDSGYGFVDGQAVNISGGGSGFAVLFKQGQHQGYYSTIGGFLSDRKKLFDGYYYQNYSYEIISPIMLSKYQSMLKAIAHPAGIALFGKFAYTNDTNEDKTIWTASITKSTSINNLDMSQEYNSFYIPLIIGTT